MPPRGTARARAVQEREQRRSQRRRIQQGGERETSASCVGFGAVLVHVLSYTLCFGAGLALGVTEQTPEAHRAPKDSPKVHRTLENAGCSRSGGTVMAENGSRGSPGRRGLKDMKPLPRLQFGEGVGTGGIRQSMDSVRSVHESLPGSPSMLSMRGCMAVSVSGIAPACRRVYRSAYLQQYGAR